MVFAILVLFCLFAVVLVFLYRGAARRRETGWVFCRGLVSYGILATYFCFVSAGVASGVVRLEWLLKGAASSCLFGIVLGLLHDGRYPSACFCGSKAF
ncbi:hypothetical protein [Bartonella senegalensis]|uniref:hypothetical protein n=1 Tax=Bartonella senegalensis TaxID=1468418 RepID=UPI0002E70521|nr:hypothetical protein [Bartonella senegalensis]